MKTTTPGTRIFGSLFRSFKSAAVLGLLLLASSGSSQAEKLPTISVGPTENESNLHYWQPAIGKGLAQMMTTQLGKMKDKFQVVESLNLEDLRNERRLGESGEVAASESVKKGQWLGADYIFILKVTRFGNAQKQNRIDTGWLMNRLPIPHPNIGPTSLGWEKSEYEVQLDWRIVDAASRAQIAEGQGSGFRKDTKFNIHSWGRGGFGENNFQAADSAIGKACMEAISNIVVQVKAAYIPVGARTEKNRKDQENAERTMKSVKGIVKMVDKDTKEVWVSLGTSNGFTKGDKVKIYKPVEKKNSQGETVATDYAEAGEITLEKVKTETSMGRFNGTGSIKENWVAAAANVDIDGL